MIAVCFMIPSRYQVLCTGRQTTCTIITCKKHDIQNVPAMFHVRTPRKSVLVNFAISVFAEALLISYCSFPQQQKGIEKKTNSCPNWYRYQQNPNYPNHQRPIKDFAPCWLIKIKILSCKIIVKDSFILAYIERSLILCGCKSFVIRN